MSPFLTHLHERLVDPYYKDGTGLWELLEEFRIWSERLGRVVIIPRGFRHDHASVPRVPGIYAAYGNRYHRPAVAHDWLCEEGLVDRKLADRVFLDLMRAQNAEELDDMRSRGAQAHLVDSRGEALEARATSMYAAVALFSWTGLWRDDAAPGAK